MLVLSRQLDEEIVLILPDSVEITVALVSIRGDKVRLGFDAPREIEIHRREIYDRIRREGRRAAQIGPEDLAAPAPAPAPASEPQRLTGLVAGSVP